MKERDYQKALLVAKIDAHRSILGLEMRAARTTFDPLGIALSFLGLDRALVKILSPILRAVTASLREESETAEKAES